MARPDSAPAECVALTGGGAGGAAQGGPSPGHGPRAHQSRDPSGGHVTPCWGTGQPSRSTSGRPRAPSSSREAGQSLRSRACQTRGGRAAGRECLPEPGRTVPSPGGRSRGKRRLRSRACQTRGGRAAGRECLPEPRRASPSPGGRSRGKRRLRSRACQSRGGRAAGRKGLPEQAARAGRQAGSASPSPGVPPRAQEGLPEPGRTVPREATPPISCLPVTRWPGGRPEGPPRAGREGRAAGRECLPEPRRASPSPGGRSRGKRRLRSRDCQSRRPGTLT